MNLIVAVDLNHAIGCKNTLLFRSKADMKHFRETTIGQHVIVGRNTLESFPKGQPLKGRTTHILSGALTVAPSNEAGDAVYVSGSVPDLLSAVHPDAWVCGGASVYRQLLPFCDTISMTTFEERAADSDAFFPAIEHMPNIWKQTGRQELPLETPPLTFSTYQRTSSNVSAVILEQVNSDTLTYTLRPAGNPQLVLKDEHGVLTPMSDFSSVLWFFRKRMSCGISQTFRFISVTTEEEYP